MSALLAGPPDDSALPRLTFVQARQAAAQLLAMTGKGAPVDDSLQLRIQRFCSMEARLLDSERYHDWYDLLADDLFYWLPLHENRFRRDSRPAISPDNMALFDECKADIAVRLGRLDSRRVWTEDPATRHIYVVSNIEGFETEVPNEYEVHSTFVQYRNRSEHDDAMLCGRRLDLLRIVGGEFRLARRLILLPQSVLLTKNLSVFF